MKRSFAFILGYFLQLLLIVAVVVAAQESSEQPQDVVAVAEKKKGNGLFYPRPNVVGRNQNERNLKWYRKKQQKQKGKKLFVNGMNRNQGNFIERSSSMVGSMMVQQGRARRKRGRRRKGKVFVNGMNRNQGNFIKLSSSKSSSRISRMVMSGMMSNIQRSMMMMKKKKMGRMGSGKGRGKGSSRSGSSKGGRRKMRGRRRMMRPYGGQRGRMMMTALGIIGDGPTPPGGGGGQQQTTSDDRGDGNGNENGVDDVEDDADVDVEDDEGFPPPFEPFTGLLEFLPDIVIADAELQLNYFEGVPNLNLTLEEVDELKDLVDEFYTTTFSTDPAFADTFIQYQTSVLPADYDEGRDNPNFVFRFIAGFDFEEGSEPTGDEVFTKMESANYLSFITDYLFRNPPLNQLDNVQQVTFFASLTVDEQTGSFIT